MTAAQALVRTYRPTSWMLVALLGACHAAAAPSTTSAAAPSTTSTSAAGAAAGADAPAPIARFVAASGGAAWDAIAAIESRATLAAGGLTGEATILEDVRTGRSRSQTRLGPVETAEGFDGQVSWEQAVGGEVVVLDAPEARQRAITTRWLTARGYARPGGVRYRALGARTIGARQLHAIEATPDGGGPIELWFDDATGLLAQTVHLEGKDTVTTALDDYRAVGGVRIAFRSVIDRDDPRNRVTLVITDAQPRPVAPAAAAFARPGGDDRISFAGAAHRTQLPFELINNHIYIHAQIDGQPVRVLVDTGGLNMLTPAAAARLGLATAGKMAASGAGERKVDVGFARARQLAVGDVQLAAPVFYVLDFEALSDVEGEVFDGLVGFEIFQRLAVRIDYPARQLTLTRRDDFTPPAGAITVPFELRDRTPIAAGSIDGVPARLAIDTGARNSLTANSPFVRAHDLEARYHPAFETLVGWGVGGGSRAKPVRFKQVKLGDAAIADVAGELFTGDKGAFADPDSSANLGGGILRRFAVTFDYRDKKMFLEPGPAQPRDVYDRAGMFFLRDGDAIKIAAVVPNGPAARAGLVEGDRVVAIDGAAIASRPLAGWRQVLSAGAIGARHRLTVDAAGARKDRTLVLAELLP